MPLSAGPYFFTLFGGVNTMMPLVISPVEGYVAPDGLSSWTALGIHGYVLRYNEFLDQINKLIDAGYRAGCSLENPHLTETLRRTIEDQVRHCLSWGVSECKKFIEYLAATQDSLVAGCAQLKLPLPRHGSTPGVKPVYAPGMDIPPGSWAAT